ncbi:hypothetical protein FRZ67_21245 [Panacibacter ginsenosidivorans]|uniref:Uncharacterized protein n=1 Tax=Panacibacter ginsenosidivorans TaxID=1813871 RepID=A0A5B8VE55_9BACT|nr:hypothetical protein [Panacibacter ginsenosidivorans]QEC69700.1 hypothetical protein FRZ67_21245 [Panacibacter ginsenosidivorans]
MNIQNIDSLTGTLCSLGFARDFGNKLLRHICFRKPEFTIRERLIIGSDVVNFNLVFQCKSEKHEYACIYYDATLRKEINVTGSVINGINTKELEKQMQEVDWSIDYENQIDKKFNSQEKDSWLREEKIDKVVMQLHSLSSVEEGEDIADCLRFKFWSDTPAQEMVRNTNTLKSRYEISQRFYFFDNGSCISAEEACRFLNNRWMEKNMQSKRRQEENNNTENAGSSGDKIVNEKKLPKKKHGKAVRSRS